MYFDIDFDDDDDEYVVDPLEDLSIVVQTACRPYRHCRHLLPL
jgi:hypothetical protein